MDATTLSPPQALYGTEDARLAAVRRRDPAADGCFVFAVLTTGVYCRPSCAARPARAENIRFYPDVAAAKRAGYRACKRCHPDLPPRATREAGLVAAACRSLEAAETPPPLAALAADAGLSPGHFHQLFKRVAGVTPKAYAAACRQARVQGELAAGAGVTAALYAAGFGSSGRFYAGTDDMLGMVPSRYRAGGAGETIRHAAGRSSLGPVLVAATARGICAILIGDDLDVLRRDLADRFPAATLEPADPGFAARVAAVVAVLDSPSGSPSADLPLDIRGTAFQRRVWAALRAIPPGETRSYAAVAAALGVPRAVRAVAAACGANKLAVVIPCHRVVGTDGALRGYRWGVERKRALLAREAAASGRPRKA
jgi:AraC family transcriptional regulator of adaptative response/methylated-DNA-[protein]-cysteine methyltransferase